MACYCRFSSFLPSLFLVLTQLPPAPMPTSRIWEAHVDGTATLPTDPSITLSIFSIKLIFIMRERNAILSNLEGLLYSHRLSWPQPGMGLGANGAPGAQWEGENVRALGV